MGCHQNPHQIGQDIPPRKIQTSQVKWMSYYVVTGNLVADLQGIFYFGSGDHDQLIRMVAHRSNDIKRTIQGSHWRLWLSQSCQGTTSVSTWDKKYAHGSWSLPPLSTGHISGCRNGRILYSPYLISNLHIWPSTAMAIALGSPFYTPCILKKDGLVVSHHN